VAKVDDGGGTEGALGALDEELVAAELVEDSTKVTRSYRVPDYD